MLSPVPLAADTPDEGLLACPCAAWANDGEPDCSRLDSVHCKIEASGRPGAGLSS